MKRKQGISLIVLVITIIVMIILAAAVVVSLNNTGIIGKANEAVNKTNLKQVEQMASLYWADAFSDGLRGEYLEEEVLGKLEDYTDDYDFIVTDGGVTVTEKGEGGTKPVVDQYTAISTDYFDFEFDSTTMTAKLTGVKTAYQETGYYDPTRYNIPFIKAIIDGNGNRVLNIILPSKVTGSDGNEYTITTIGERALAIQEFVSNPAEPLFTTLVLPETVTTIEERAVYSWSAATKLVLPKSLTTIKNNAFGYWGSLSNVYYAGTEAEWNAITIEQQMQNTIGFTSATKTYNYAYTIAE